MNLGFQVFLKASLLSDSWGGGAASGSAHPSRWSPYPAPHGAARGTQEPLAQARPLPSRPHSVSPHSLEFLQYAGPVLASEEAMVSPSPGVSPFRGSLGEMSDHLHCRDDQQAVP